MHSYYSHANVFFKVHFYSYIYIYIEREREREREREIIK